MKHRRWLPLLLAGLAAATAIAALEVTARESPGTTGGQGHLSPAATSTPVVVHVPAIARDGPQPTPTPVPLPFAARGCYEARTSNPALVLADADPQSVFQNCQVVAYYGSPAHAGLGVLGEGTTEQMLARLGTEVAAFDAANGARGVVPGFHVIFAVAQGYPTADGTALSRLSAAQVQPYIDLAEAQDALVILDLQMGWSSVDAEVAHVREFLRHPRVHLALDPEWAMPAGVLPGTRIGSMDASEINRAQEILQAIAVETGVRKILVVHQFTVGMITNKTAIEDFSLVDLVIDMDGFGNQAPKIGGYNRYIRDDGAEHGGFKLFYDEDINLMTAAEVNALQPQPGLVIYQ